MARATNRNTSGLGAGTGGASTSGSFGAANPASIYRRPGTAAIGGGGTTAARPAAGATLPTPAAPAGAGGPVVPAPPAGPGIPEYRVNEQAPPELVAARQRAEKYLGELETGAGYASDVMHGKMQATIDADVERAREQAAAQGMPFDEAAFRRDAEQAKQSGLAEEKLGRERLRGEQMQGLLGTIGAGEQARMARSEFELGRQSLPVEQGLKKFGTQAGIYGTEVGAATDIYRTNANTAIAAQNALLDFLKGSFSFSA